MSQAAPTHGTVALTMCMMISFYTFLAAAGVWMVDEAFRLGTRPKKLASAS